MHVLRRPPDLACQQMVALVTEYLDGALSRADARRFETHLRRCPDCTVYLEQMRATIRATGTLRAEDLPPDVLGEFTALFRAWRSTDGGDGH